MTLLGFSPIIKNKHVKGGSSVKIRKVIMSIVVIVIVIFCLLSAFLFHASAPIRKERKETIALAEKYADLKKAEDFYWYDRDKTYYTIMGVNADHQDVIVTVPKDGDTIKVLNQKDGVTEQDVINTMHDKYHPYKINKIEFGYIKDTPIWEVTVINKNDTLSYYNFRFSNGKLYSKTTDF